MTVCNILEMQRPFASEFPDFPLLATSMLASNRWDDASLHAVESLTGVGWAGCDQLCRPFAAVVSVPSSAAKNRQTRMCTISFTHPRRALAGARTPFFVLQSQLRPVRSCAHSMARVFRAKNTLPRHSCRTGGRCKGPGH